MRATAEYKYTAGPRAGDRRRARSCASRRGFTLVELIVVLTILSILAAVGVGSAVGYIKRSRFDQNEQNAITVYQMAQTAISQKTSNGTIDNWARDVLNMNGVALNTSGLDQPNESVHVKTALTYNPGSSDNKLYDLLSSYIYDTSIFGGTISVEFDISATADSDGSGICYSAVACSAFYSQQNTAATGWDATCLGNSTDGLPRRDFDYRSRTSYVGYFDGTEASVIGTGASGVTFLGPVILPYDEEIDEVDRDFLFTVRNGETLDLTWSFFAKDSNHDAQLTIKLYNADDPNADPVILTIDETALVYDQTNKKIVTIPSFEEGMLPGGIAPLQKQSERTVYETVKKGYTSFLITRQSISTLAVVKVNGVAKVFPLTITRVLGDGQLNYPNPLTGYTSFTLSIDCMMSRVDYDEKGTATTDNNMFISSRLFGDINPRNIYATIQGSVGTETIAEQEATRALNDPAYLTSVNNNTGKLRYNYTVSKSKVKSWDGHYCVFNTLFGDAVVSGSTGLLAPVEGSFSGADGGDAVITSFRHLSNVRRIPDGTIATYRISKDLNWYYHLNGQYTSEVKVYTRLDYGNGDSKTKRLKTQSGDNDTPRYYYRFHSPVEGGYGSSLNVVSFPALKEFYSGQTLLSTSASINNVQLRRPSFVKSDGSVNSDGYGLICKNSGTVYNIYVNNLSLTLADVRDGYASDYSGGSEVTSSFSPDSVIELDGVAIVNWYNKPIGGLIGRNDGTLGSDNSSISAADNNIRMNNCVVLAGDYWKIREYDQGIGIVVGRNNGNVNGLLRIDGSFAVSGYKYVGGIIGWNNHDIAGRFEVDASPVGTPEIALPQVKHVNDYVDWSNSGSNASIIIGTYRVGGAIGYAQNTRFAYEASGYSSSYNTSTRELSYTEPSNYQFYINLPETSLIWSVCNRSGDSGVGGAIGMAESCSGELTIKVENNGRIQADNTYYTYKNCQTAAGVGYLLNSAITGAYIDVTNSRDSVIENVLWTDSSSAGGAVGAIHNGSIENSSFRVSNEGRIYVRTVVDRNVNSGGVIGRIQKCTVGGNNHIYVKNSGSIVVRTAFAAESGNWNACGGAIGYTNDCTFAGSEMVINADNLSTSSIGYDPDNPDVAEVNMSGNSGGAIGKIGNGDKIQGNVTINVENSGVISARGVNSSGGNDIFYGAGGAIGAFKGNAGYVNDAGEQVPASIDINVVNNSNSRIIHNTDHKVDTSYKSGAGGVIGSNWLNTPAYVTDSSVIRVTNYGIISGFNTVGGAFGYAQCSPGMVTADNYGTIEGNDRVGGAIGYAYSSQGNITVNNHGTSEVQGASCVSGGIGYGYVILSEITVNMTESSEVTGSGDYVGGAVGRVDNNNNGKLNKAASYISDTASVQGKSYVGGTVGFANANITSEASCRLENSATVTGEGLFVGGSVGYNARAATAVSSEVLGSATVTGKAFVGGAIGYIGYIEGADSNSGYASFGTVTAKIEGSVTGGSVTSIDDIEEFAPAFNFAGNSGSTEYDRFNVNVLELNYGSTVESSGMSCVGGAIGYCKSAGTRVDATVLGSVTADGDCVGGAIGYAVGQKKIVDINATIGETGSSANAVVSGEHCVGGAIGYNKDTITNINVSITGTSYVEGRYNVGGAVGWFSATTITQDINRNGSVSGSDNNINVVIDSDEAIRGWRCLGGVIGRSGDKAIKKGTAAGTYIWYGTFTVEMNSGNLFRQLEEVPPDQDGCIGGVIGFVSDMGNLNNIIITGTGGTVNPGHPDRNISNTVLIHGTGRSMGGIIGHLGNEGIQCKCQVDHVDTSNAPSFCVISDNGSDRIGGWFGSTFGQSFGLVSKSTYNVTNVRSVYSEGSEVGAFAGRADAYNGSNGQPRNTDQNHITVTLNATNITGKSRVGGAIGYFHIVGFTSGSLTVNLNNHTNIGDEIGNTLPGDFTVDEPICYNAGGAIGEVSAGYISGNRSSISVPITVNIDATSRVYGGAEPSSHAEDYGVGGAIGITGLAVDTGYIEKYGIDPETIGGISITGEVKVESQNSEMAVYAAHTNAGGLVGAMFGGSIKTGSTNAVTVCGAEGMCVGGFVGRMTGGTVGKDGNANGLASASGTVRSDGAHSYAGGFVGRLEDGTITRSYTTDTTSSVGAFTGGFAGRFDSGTISNSYVGGHTYGGQYESGAGNVTGNGNTGGFVGYIASGATIGDDCYTTASVLGNGDYVGGFAGFADSGSTIKKSYTTARVLNSSDTSDSSTGAFAGYSLGTLTSNQTMSLINDITMRLLGNADNTEDVTGVSWNTQAQIRNNKTYTAYPQDSYLGSGSVSYPLRAVIDSKHYGDWPLPATGINLEGATVTLTNGEEYFYRQDNVTFTADDITVTYQGNELVYGTDYTLRYRYNDRVSTTDADGNVTRFAEVIVVAKAGSNYSGSVTKTFTIVPVDITDAAITLVDPDRIYTYTGAPIEPEITIRLGSDEYELTSDDYYVTYSPGNENVGNVTATVHGTGNYTGIAAQTFSFEIQGASIEDAQISLINATASARTYNGEERKAGVVVRLGGRTLTPDIDYEISYSEDLLNVGQVTITVTGKGNYLDSKEVTYDIISATNRWINEPSIADTEFGRDPVLNASPMFGSDMMTCEYYSDEDLTQPVAVIASAPVGHYYAKVTVPVEARYGNYTGLESVVSFSVTPVTLTDDMVTMAPETSEFTGSDQKPSVEVVYADRALDPSSDYTVEIFSDGIVVNNCIDVGTYTVRIAGKGNFTGTVTKTYEITKKMITDEMVVLVTDSYPWTGRAIVPGLVVNNGDLRLTEATDYTVECSNNIDHGTATVTITGIGNYEGNVLRNFQIVRKQYTVTFETNGGSVIANASVFEGLAVGCPADPVKEGYTFSGWYTDNVLTYAYDFSGAVNEDFTLYAKWIINEYTVSFDVNGHGTAPEVQPVQYGDRATKPGIDPIEGYTFAGWYTDQRCTQAYNFADAVTGDITLYAKWEEQTTEGG